MYMFKRTCVTYALEDVNKNSQSDPVSVTEQILRSQGSDSMKQFIVMKVIELKLYRKT